MFQSSDAWCPWLQNSTQAASVPKWLLVTPCYITHVCTKEIDVQMHKGGRDDTGPSSIRLCGQSVYIQYILYTYVFKYFFIPLKSKRELPDPMSCNTVQEQKKEGRPRLGLAPPVIGAHLSPAKTLQSCTGRMASKGMVRCLATQAGRLLQLYKDKHEQKWPPPKPPRQRGWGNSLAREALQEPLSDLPPNVTNGPVKVESCLLNRPKLSNRSRKNVVSRLQSCTVPDILGRKCSSLGKNARKRPSLGLCQADLWKTSLGKKGVEWHAGCLVDRNLLRSITQIVPGDANVKLELLLRVDPQ